MRVIGIDPAPSKHTAAYDGNKFYEIELSELRGWIQEKACGDNTLLCWDAPLTASIHGEQVDFYARPIERTINTIDKNIKDAKHKRPPSGVSTLGYAGCPHWVITQYCLDLPSVYDSNCKGAFELITDNNFSKNKNCVIEVHPALALWCWLNEDNKYTGDWHYKGGTKKAERNLRLDNLRNLVDALHDVTRKFGEDFQMNSETIEQIKNDTGGDHLDAYIAWILGELWAKEVKNNKGESVVVLVGNRDTGAILLPNTDWSKALCKKL